MSVQLLQTLSLIAFIVAAVLFLIAVALFFLLDIPKLYGDISGRTARKAIEAIREQNRASGNKAYHPSAVNEERGRLTDRITQSGNLESRQADMSIGVGTEKFSTEMIYSQSNETTILNGEYSAASETTILTNNVVDENSSTTNNGFSLEVEISFTGSSDIIE